MDVRRRALDVRHDDASPALEGLLATRDVDVGTVALIGCQQRRVEGYRSIDVRIERCFVTIVDRKAGVVTGTRSFEAKAPTGLIYAEQRGDVPPRQSYTPRSEIDQFLASLPRRP